MLLPTADAIPEHNPKKLEPGQTKAQRLRAEAGANRKEEVNNKASEFLNASNHHTKLPRERIATARPVK